MGACPSQPLHLKVYAPKFHSTKKFINPHIMWFSRLKLVCFLPALLCLLTHFLKSDLSSLLSFSLSTPVAVTPPNQQEERWQQKQKIFITFTREYKLLFSHERQGRTTVDRTTMEQLTYFFQREPHLSLQSPSTSCKPHRNTDLDSQSCHQFSLAVERV